MAITAARLLVAPPSRAPLPYGLLSVAQMPTDTDVHWRNGVRYEIPPCEPGEITTEVCPATGAPELKDPTETQVCRAALPFTVYTLPICSPVGYWDRAEDVAVGALTNGEARAVEREFWTGEHGTTFHLAEDTAVTGSDGCIEQTAATVVTTGAADVTFAVARLEEALSECYGNEGVIHVTPGILTLMENRQLVRRDGPRLRTPNNHLIAAGAGYPGTAPDGTGPGTTERWIYATGAITVRRGEVQVTSTRGEALDRNRNDLILVAERTYVITVDCCHFAAQAIF